MSSLDHILSGRFGGMKKKAEMEDVGLEELLSEIPFDEMSEEELAALVQDAVEELGDEEGGLGGLGGGEEAALAAALAAEEDPDEVADKLAAASDFLGRVQAHAFMDELTKISEETGKKPEKTAKEEVPESKLARAIAILRGE